ncbi:uncharacterized protein yc1106_02693 [Curvularia clavata]|uniref:Uncharacterized protein n=1 Tax=Curvularia clavata TaxID=95742 RepID=A0A9Q8Z3Q2_CURCL|nr:uncharacterized protein yc1106_02693 [Curvularia clavata]
MLRETLQNTCLVLLSLSTTSAGFSDFFFAGNGGNASEPRTCPGSPWDCPPPNICAHDDKLDKYYCCIPGSQDAVCWAPSDGCDGADSTTPGGNQQSCGSGINTFCCLKSSEHCTERQNQTNICWSSAPNPIASLNETAVNETAHSLESARPSASSYVVQLAALATLTSTTPGLPSATKSTPASSPTTSPSQETSSSTPTGDSSSGISGGAIGGIVGGVVGGLALLGVVGYFLWRRRKNNKHNPYKAANMHEPSHVDEAPSAPAAAETSSNPLYAEAPATENSAGAKATAEDLPPNEIIANKTDPSVAPLDSPPDWVYPETLPPMPQCIAQQDQSAWLNAMTKCTKKQCMRHFGVICTRHQWRTQLSCLNIELSPQVVQEYISYCSRSVLAKAQVYQWIRTVTDRTWLVEVGDTNGLQTLSPASLSKGYTSVSVINKAPTCLAESTSPMSMESFGHIMTSCGFEAYSRHTGNAARPWEYRESLHSMIALDAETVGYDLVHHNIPFGNYFDKQCFCRTFDASLATADCVGPGLSSTMERLWMSATCGTDALPSNWTRGLKTTVHDYIPTEAWSWPQCFRSMPLSVVELHGECTTNACKIDSDGYCEVTRAVDRACFCRNIDYDTCSGPCHIFETRIDYVRWLHNLCGAEEGWNGLPEHWRRLARITPLDLIPWTWYVNSSGHSNLALGEKGREGLDFKPSCASNEWKSMSLIFANLAALFTAVFGSRPGARSTAPRPLNRVLWFPKGISIAALCFLANIVNAWLIQSTPGYEDVSIIDLALLWCSMPRFTWLTVPLILTNPYNRSTFCTVAASVVSEILLQALSASSIVTTVAYGHKHNFYSQSMERLDSAPSAKFMYAGALIWVFIVFASSILLIQALWDVSTSFSVDETPTPRPINPRDMHLAAQLKEPFVEQWTWLEEKIAEYWIDKDWDLEASPLMRDGRTYPVYGTLPTKSRDNRKTKRRMVRLTLIAIVSMFFLWVAQWMFWLGFIGLTADE